MGGGVSKTKPLPKSSELALFKEMDADGSGALSVDELKAALEKHAAAVALTWKVEDIDQVVSFFDRDRDGQLDEKEFAEAVTELKKREAAQPVARGPAKLGPAKLAPISRGAHSGSTVGVAALDDELMSQAKDIFGGIDNSSDGFVQKAELRRALWELKRSADGNTETEIAFLAFVDREFAKADKNLDAKLDFDEFMQLFATVAAAMKT